MGKVPATATFFGTCVGCQYPEHREAVTEMLGMEAPEEEIWFHKVNVEVEEGKWEIGVEVYIPGEGGPNRIGWIAVADIDDALEFLAIANKIAVASMETKPGGSKGYGHEQILNIEEVKWENEEEGILKWFRFTATVDGLIRE